MVPRILLLAALSLLTGSASALPVTAQGARVQLLAGPAFESLAARTDALCPEARIRFTTPADLAWQEERFDETLSPAERRRERRAIPRDSSGGPARCADRDGLSCPAVANLEAIARARLAEGFARFACAHRPLGLR